MIPITGRKSIRLDIYKTIVCKIPAITDANSFVTGPLIY